MSKEMVNEITVIGLALKSKTTNAGGQSATDCRNLWHHFDDGDFQSVIPGKTADTVYGVYFHYEGDSSLPFSYLVGCPVSPGSIAPPGMISLTIPAGDYEKIAACGKLPDCVIQAWIEIRNGNYPRTFQTDFEVYDERSRDWNQGEVDVFVSVKS